jgi:hypothetical protein
MIWLYALALTLSITSLILSIRTLHRIRREVAAREARRKELASLDITKMYQDALKRQSEGS